MPCCGGHGQKPTCLIIGGQFTGLFAAKDLKKHFNVVIVDAKEFFEYTPGVLRAFVKPAHFDSLSFTLQPVVERSMGVKFIWGEVLKVDGEKQVAEVKTMFGGTDEIKYDYCLICSGCNFGPFKKNGESLWFPVVHEAARTTSEWKHIDERFIDGRRRHILEEYHALGELDKSRAKILVVGAGFIGVEWVTELGYFFPNLHLTIIDFLPMPLGPLPAAAAEYCVDYMNSVDIKQCYSQKYAPDDPAFWNGIGLPLEEGKKTGADRIDVCIGVKASNFYMPAEVLSNFGPGGGGWIHMNQQLQVTKKPQECDVSEGYPLESHVWGKGRVFAVGDSNYGCLEDWEPTKEGHKDAPFRKPKANRVDVMEMKNVLVKGDQLAVEEITLEYDKGKPKAWKVTKGEGDVKAGDIIMDRMLVSGKAAEDLRSTVKVNLRRGGGPKWVLPPIPKISYPGEEQALHACVNITRHSNGKARKMGKTWWPWGAGMFATSLGPHDACFVMAANDKKGSGWMVNWWIPAALQKEIIETTKVNECANGWIGTLIWHFVHHTPVHLWGKAPCCGI